MKRETNVKTDDLVDDVLIAMRRMIRAIELHSQFLVQHHGLTGPQLLVLRKLKAMGESSLTELARAVHLSHATVTGIVSRLEKQGLAKRVRSKADKRQMCVSVTSNAQKLLRDAPPMLQDSFTKQFQALKSWEKHQILTSVHRLVAMMEAEQLDASPILTTGPANSGL